MESNGEINSPNQKSNRKIIIIGILGGIGVIMLCCCSLLAYGLYYSSTPEGQANATARAQEQQIVREEQAKSTEEARPTNTSLPTKTSSPTHTPIAIPTDTPIPPTNTPEPTNTLEPTSTPKPSITPSPEPTVTPQWFEGGTLHSATVAEWRSATDQNQLATAADWIVVLSPTVLPSQLKEMATELTICTNVTIDGLEGIENSKITEISLLCALTLGYVEE